MQPVAVEYGPAVYHIQCADRDMIRLDIWNVGLEAGRNFVIFEATH